MFGGLSQNFSKIFSGINKKLVLNEDDVKEAMREIRVALLEADVSLKVVKKFIEEITEQALGEKILKTIKPGQMVFKLVHDGLVKLLSQGDSKINLLNSKLNILMLVGLQGSGKTTTSGKLALYLKNNQKKKILLASLDTERPAAQEQLEVLAKKNEIDSLEIIKGEKPLDIARRAHNYALKNGYEVLILDTAGRLHVDDSLMGELVNIESLTKPQEILLVADSLTGQDAVNIAENFKAKLSLTGIILTRLDGDAKGGAALSMAYATNCPIKFLGIGEKSQDLQVFDPSRIADRILDKGDIIELVEKASSLIDEKDAEKMEEIAKKGKMDLSDLLRSLEKAEKLQKAFGGMSNMMNLLPGANKFKQAMPDAESAKKSIDKQIAIINSMTRKERRNPDLLNGSRKKRVALGSGVKVEEINKLLKNLMEMNKMMKSFKFSDKNSLLKDGIKGLFG